MFKSMPLSMACLRSGLSPNPNPKQLRERHSATVPAKEVCKGPCDNTVHQTFRSVAWRRTGLYPVRTEGDFLQHHERNGQFKFEDTEAASYEEDDFGLVQQALDLAKENDGDPLEIFFDLFTDWTTSITDQDSVEKRARAFAASLLTGVLSVSIVQSFK